MIDARETAPGKAKPDLYIGADGKPDAKASLQGMKAAAIPGIPAALPWLAQRYGGLPLATTLAPAIRACARRICHRRALCVRRRLAARHADQANAAARRAFSWIRLRRRHRASSCASPIWRARCRRSRAQGRAGFYEGDVRGEWWPRCRPAVASGSWTICSDTGSSSARPSASLIVARASPALALPSAGGLDARAEPANSRALSVARIEPV